MSVNQYITNLDWGDGSKKDFVTKPKKFLDSQDVFEHFYDKPGFYSITGLVFSYDEDSKRIISWEKFKSNMVVNQSDSYESPFIENEEVAMIGGYTEKSAYFKTLLMLSGFRFDKTKKVDIKKLDLNEFDKINLMNTIMKFDSKLYNDILDSYINPIFSDDEIINNNYSNIRQYDTLSNTGLNNVDVGSCKMYSGVRKIHQHLGFNNQSDGANPNENSYWKNIIPKGWKWTDKEGIEYGVFREPTSGSKALIDEYKEYQVDDSDEQNWVNGYWPVLPKIDKNGKFMSEVTSSYGLRTVAIGEKEGSGGERSLMLDIDFNQDTVDDLIDKTSQFDIVPSSDFNIVLDSNGRVEKNQIDSIELLEKINSKQAF